MKVYVITIGEYSDMHVAHVTDDYEVAMEYVTAIDDDTACIEEFDTKELKADLKKRKKILDTHTDKHIFYCSMDFDGFISILEYGLFECNIDMLDNDKIDVDDYFGHYTMLITAKDKEHATKIFTDKVAQYKYENMEYIQKIKNEIEERKNKPKTPNISFGDLVIDSIKFKED